MVLVLSVAVLVPLTSVSLLLMAGKIASRFSVVASMRGCRRIALQGGRAVEVRLSCKFSSDANFCRKKIRFLGEFFGIILNLCESSFLSY